MRLTQGTSQFTCSSGNNRWHTFDMLQWPMVSTRHQSITGGQRTLALNLCRSTMDKTNRHFWTISTMGLITQSELGVEHSFNVTSVPQLARTEQFDSRAQQVLGGRQTIKPQYVMADNGVERDHKQAMALHRWHRDSHMVLNDQQMTMRINNAGNGESCSGTVR
eukprot:4319479-Amphidinium_carterae.2